jgi:pimeloyl-ACP methyl ester carboxylesterase
MWAGFTPDQRRTLEEGGRIEVPSAYSDEAYPITARLIEDGRRHLVLRTPLELPFPVRLLQGMADVDVPVPVALRLAEQASCADLRLVLVKGADHRFSAPDELVLLGQTLDELSGRLEKSGG